MQQSGFTLIEAVVAAAIVATAVVVVAHLAALGIHQSVNSRRTLSALAASQGKLEALAASGLAIGSGQDAGEFVLRWAIAAVEPADPTLLTLQVCAYASSEPRVPPEVCVATIRGSVP